MRHHSHKDKAERFLKDFEETSTTVMIGLMVISAGLYSIIWIYITSKLLQEHNIHAPESSRGLIVMAALPLSWFFISSFIQNKLLNSVPLLYTIFDIGIWGFIFFLIFKFYIDFVHSFTQITQSHPIIWNGLFVIGMIGVVGLIINMISLYPFLIGIVFAVIGMQTELNSLLKGHTIKKVSSVYYGK
ncbi:MAG: hypothetical protein HRU03_00800 [Nanoarchaeales archaeon]|nr:hypothetical protein [Nanoarchaeales archaeon]